LRGSLDTLAAADWPRWAAGIETQLRAAEEAAGSDPERPLNLLRDAHHAQVFRLLIADLNGHLTVERLADHLSALADAVLDLALRSVWRAWHASRGLRDEGAQAPAPPFAVIGYGKLGGKELGYASDLDLIFVYDDLQPDAAAVHAQIARRLVACLTTPTPSGILFEIDLRLRPNGNAGLLVSPIEAFEHYQRNADGHGAWVWEHQALTRARWCAGDPQLGARFERLRREVLARARDPGPLAAEVVAMRRRMLDGHPNRSTRFDLKHDRGGMVDVEFVVQFLVLAHSHRHPELLDDLGNIRLLGIAAELGLLEAPLAAAAADAYRHYRRLQHALRLNGAPVARVAHEEARTRIDTVLHLWRSVLGTDEPRPQKPGAG
ncbi:MAG TPA: bifunctional [glutamate--ammonia ligase]-adenylyl-L-tyrosine phosphorylase/[glutamate--ammonia-ligase] adenylyltransferase, partial [Burkholderiaceae bacterium]